MNVHSLCQIQLTCKWWLQENEYNEEKTAKQQQSFSFVCFMYIPRVKKSSAVNMCDLRIWKQINWYKSNYFNFKKSHWSAEAFIESLSEAAFNCGFLIQNMDTVQ